MAMQWKSCNANEKFPKKALAGGRDVDGAKMIIGRVNFNGMMLPAKIIPAKQRASISFNGAEICVTNYEILIGKAKIFEWIPASHGRVPEQAVFSGTINGENIFIGRVPFESTMTVGRVQPSHGCIYIPFNGVEVRLIHYEVLSLRKKSNSSSSSSSD